MTTVLANWKPYAIGLLLALTAVTATAQERASLKWPTLAIVAASAIDELSTEYNLSQGRERMTMPDGREIDVVSRESSPQIAWLQGNRPAMYAFSTGLTVTGILALRAIGNHGHPTIAKYGMYVWSAVRINAAIGNIQAGNEHRNYRRLAISVRAF